MQSFYQWKNNNRETVSDNQGSIYYIVMKV